MSEIRRADKADIPAMTEIWIDSFGDSGEYVGRFMDERLPSSAALVLSDEGTVMSQLFLLPGEMSVSEKRQPALYLYAAATRPDGRGRGYMSLLIEAAKDYAEKNGFAYIALVPGEDGLYDYYSRFGFYEAFGYRLLRKSRSGLQKAAGARGEKLTMTSASMTAVRNKCCRARTLLSGTKTRSRSQSASIPSAADWCFARKMHGLCYMRKTARQRLQSFAPVKKASAKLRPPCSTIRTRNILNSECRRTRC